MSSFLLHKRTHAGFSLVEVLVSMSLFTMVATTAVGVLLVMMDANRKSQSIESAMSNLSFALDSMTRDIRTGTFYHCGQAAGWLSDGATPNYNDCTVSSNSLSFIEAGSSLTTSCTNHRVAFRLNNGVIERSLCGSNVIWDPITSASVNITDLEFVVTGSTPGDSVPPLVSIYLAGDVTGIRSTGADFNIQTTVTQQLLDI